ncbi:MAG: hypothetical protein INR70_41925 [Parafilimonas terrae]|nr:hypothetical protein [Parafilimonas terrae]
MDTRVEWVARNRWDIITDDEEERRIGFAHEGSDRPEDITILPSGSDPSLLADLRGRRYGSLNAVAEAIGTHLEGACRIT